jgi:hypothetical protein
VRAVERRWGDYRRALRRRDRPHFDRLFEHASAHADAASYLNHADPEIPILVSVLLEQERRLADLDARCSTLDARCSTLESERPDREAAGAGAVVDTGDVTDGSRADDADDADDADGADDADDADGADGADGVAEG